MPRKAGGRRKRPWPRRAAPWGVLALLAIGVVVLGWHLAGEIPSSPPAAPGSTARARAEAVLGPLDSSGVRLTVADRVAAAGLVERLREARVGILGERWSGDHLRASVALDGGSVPLELRWGPGPGGGPPLLAVVIDDLGRSVEDARALLALDLVVTPAILPHQPHSEDVARLLRGHGREYLVHLPMQPQGYPEVNPGEGALLAGMTEAEVRDTVRAVLAAVPGARGVNNHMGSRFTELEAPLGWVMDELRRRNLFFLDSLTSPRSVAAQVARETGLRWARRDVFLDHVREAAAVEERIAEAVERARREGRAIAIGHPHPVTLRALEAWAPKIEAAGVRSVPLSAVLNPGNEV